jgi:hypothetical protein
MSFQTIGHGCPPTFSTILQGHAEQPPVPPQLEMQLLHDAVVVQQAIPRFPQAALLLHERAQYEP